MMNPLCISAGARGTEPFQGLFFMLVALLHVSQGMGLKHQQLPH